MSSVLSKFKGKKVALLGFGIENQALLKFLNKQKISCDITVCDTDKSIRSWASREISKNINWQLGVGYDKNLDRFDILSRIAGYPMFTKEIKKIARNELEISSPLKLFFEFCPSKNIIGVTGSKGKGTTSGLIYEILQVAGQKVFWGGNIGIPMFGFVDKIKKDDWVVLELSSFQLEDMKASPHIAVITNLFKDHLSAADPKNPNYHKSMNDYIDAKLNIIKYQKRNDIAIINKNIKLKNKKLGNGKKIYFTKSDIESRLAGDHNKENIAAALEAAKIVGVKEALAKKAVKKFKGLPHRIEFVGKYNRNKYFDDSFATTPESSIVALKSFTAPIILIAGGADKGASFKKFAQEIKKRVRFTVLLDGKATSRLKKELQRIGYKDMQGAPSMKEAIRIARKEAKIEDVVLLSTACASFGMFNNYKERGDLFKKEVRGK